MILGGKEDGQRGSLNSSCSEQRIELLLKLLGVPLCLESSDTRRCLLYRHYSVSGSRTHLPTVKAIFMVVLKFQVTSRLSCIREFFFKRDGKCFVKVVFIRNLLEI